MKILITAVIFPPQNAIASQRPYVWAREWARAGHDVTVLTIQKDETKGDLSRRAFDGFRVIEVPPGSIIAKLRKSKQLRQARTSVAAPSGIATRIKLWLRSRGFLSSVRLPDVFDFWMPQARIVLNEELAMVKFDLIVSTFGPPASLRAGWIAKKKNPTAKWVVDFRDLWSGNHVYPGLWPFTWLDRMSESFYIHRADAVTTVSLALAQELRQSTDRPVAVFENGFDPEEMQSAPRGSTPVGASDRIRLVYTGSLHPEHRNPEFFFRALAQIDPEVRSRFEVSFAGPADSFLREAIERHSVADVVRLRGSLVRSESLALQASASVLLFFEKQHEAARDGVLTGKLFEYLATGRPVWAMGIDAKSTVGRLLETNSCGIAFGTDVAKMVSALNQLAASGAAPSRDVSSAADVVQKFDRNKTAARMMTWITSGFPPSLELK